MDQPAVKLCLPTFFCRVSILGKTQKDCIDPVTLRSLGLRIEQCHTPKIRENGV